MFGFWSIWITALAISVTGLACCFHMRKRNEMVYQYLIKTIREDYEKYEQLPSYNYMFWHFWVSDLTKFEKKL